MDAKQNDTIRVEVPLPDRSWTGHLILRIAGTGMEFAIPPSEGRHEVQVRESVQVLELLIKQFEDSKIRCSILTTEASSNRPVAVRVVF